MDLKIIRVKRLLEAEPLEQLNVSCKKRKVDAPVSLPVVATVESKDENLAPIIKDIVLKCKQEKLRRLQEQKGLTHPDLFKYRPAKASARQADALASSATQRYQIVSKHRGIAELDGDSAKYLVENDRFKLDVPAEVEPLQSAAGSSSLTSQQRDANKSLDIEIVDVDTVGNEEENVICMNGEVLRRHFVYDLFLTQVPQGVLVDDFYLSNGASTSAVYDTSDGNETEDSEDSNAENYYTNDYPDEESSTEDENDSDDDVHLTALSRGDYGDPALLAMLGSLDLGSSSGSKKKFMGIDVPEHLKSVLSGSTVGCASDDESSIDGDVDDPLGDD